MKNGANKDLRKKVVEITGPELSEENINKRYSYISIVFEHDLIKR